MAVINQAQPFYKQFADVQENWDKFVINGSKDFSWGMWYDRIPKMAFPLYSGESQKTNIYRPGILQKPGLVQWRDVTYDRDPSDIDPGFNSAAASAYSPETVDLGGYETWESYGKECSYISPDLNVRALRTIHEVKAQIAMRIDFMLKNQQSVWTAWNREQYIQAAIRADHGFIMTQGGINYGLSPTNRFYYDPYTGGGTGGKETYAYFPVGVEVSSMNWSYFTIWQQYLKQQAPDAATAMKNGEPHFTIVGSCADFQKMIDDDPKLREDFRYASAPLLLKDYMSYDAYRGYTIVEDLGQARFDEVGVVTSTGANIANGRGGYLASGDWIKLKRINPETTGRQIQYGYVTDANIAWIMAPYRIGVIFMNNIFVNQVPPTIADLGSGLKFGAVPGFNGEFHWLNLPTLQGNPLSEIGNFFSRFEIHVKPMKNYMDTHIFLYRSCVAEEMTLCGDEEDDGSTSAVNLASNAASGDIDSTNYTATVTLASLLKASPGDALTVDPAVYGSTVTGYLLDSGDAPTYVIGFTSTVWATLAGDATEFTTDTTVQVA